MNDPRLLYSIRIICFVAIAIAAIVTFQHCNKKEYSKTEILQKRTIDTIVNIIPVQKIDTIKAVKIKWRTVYRTIHDNRTIDTVSYIAVSDTLRGERGTKFIVEYNSGNNNFFVPYLQERNDTTQFITDSVIVQKTIEKEQSTFWSHVGKVAGGVVGGLLISIGLR